MKMVNVSMSQRIYLYFVIVIMLSTVTIGVAGYWRSSRELENQYQALLAQIVNNAAHQTDLYLKGYERATLSILTSPLVRDALNPKETTVSDFLVKENIIKQQVFQPVLINNPEISMVYLAGNNGFRATDFNIQLNRINYKAFEEYVEQLKEDTRDDGMLMIQDSGFLDGHLTLARKISDRQTSRVYTGVMGFEMRIGELTTLWKGIQLGESGYFFIVNDRGKIIYHPDPKRIGKQLAGRQFETVQKNTDRIFDMPDEEGRIFFSRHSDYSGWTLVASMSIGETREPIAALRQTTLYVGLGTLLLASFLAIRFGRSIVNPVRRLESGMRQTEKGRWTKVALSGSRDEMDRLITSYNTMVGRLEELVDRVYESELREQDNALKRQLAEFQSLQLQINPHFLYNTLEIIICYAVIQKSSEIKEIVRSLSYMLRYSIRTDLEEITVANELKHVLHFMSIMKFRIGREFEVDVRVPPEMLLMHMVRLTLQPLIENVFKHAFPDGIEEHHRIVIDASCEQEDFYVIVEDNGCGMTPDKLNQLRTRLAMQAVPSNEEETSMPGGGSIGLVNVHSRIQMVFGEPYGLRVDSTLGQGTRMTLHMPSTGTKKVISK
ncbi:cache domain-containing sensor histidine kinase [Paenibacillus cremeus]|uniref:histidine kinase n=1 Tax=Paenibacillus cremeus TaxID=2163881 RepID=A0A559K7L1_9BACL|nr:sensor histidine kinase [Paenibacillus cremeus]TVY08112.1 HAMP domain-containing protein [Paenibacillus cremeus]